MINFSTYTKAFFVYFGFLFVLGACAGVIGHITMVDYENISKIELEKAIHRTFNRYPELLIDSNLGNIRYINNHTTKRYYCQVAENDVNYVLWIHIMNGQTPSVDNKSTLVLSGGTLLGDSINTQSSLTIREQEGYKRLFKTYFLHKLHQDTIFTYRMSPIELKKLEK
jgi:hypothetical protein